LECSPQVERQRQTDSPQQSSPAMLLLPPVKLLCRQDLPQQLRAQAQAKL